LEHLAATRIVLTGVASDQCVLATAADARMRDYEVVIARDCVASQSAWRHKTALRQFEEVHGLAVPLSSRIRLAVGGARQARARGKA
jgi:nicotinamidase-related amidase